MKLDCYLLDRRCGVLDIDDQRFRFRYLSSYVDSGGPALSVSLPVEQQQHGDRFTFPFFENLLPEGEIRELLAERLDTAGNNFARLLERTGGEVAGAIRLFPSGQAIDGVQAAPSEVLDEQALGRIFEQMASTPFLAGPDSAMRLSLAGAQSKLPVLIDGGIRLPGSQASSHILKPPSPRFPGLVENEYLCMRAAARAGLNVPAVELISFRNSLDEEHYALQIERYDRLQTSEGIKRLHQEDLCQVLGIPSAGKYNQDGGPGLIELFASVRRYTRQPAVDLRELLRRLLFNLLIGNCDAHAKNFSLLYRATGIELAPAYDLVATRAWTELSSTLAMPVGAATTIDAIDEQALHRAGQSIGVAILRQRKALSTFIDQAYELLQSEAEAVREECYRDEAQVITHAMTCFDKHHQMLRQALGFDH